MTRVSLYKNGVGFFEHAGRVSGSQAVTIDFTTDQLNDVLQSLTAIDLGGGRIAGAAYNSTTPIEQQLKALPLPLGEDPTSVDFYNAIRGARVEVRSPAGILSGRVLSFEVRTVAAPGQGGGAGSGSSQGGVSAPASEKHFLTVASDLGVVRTFELTPTTEVRLLDGPLRTDVSRYLELLASTRNRGLRHLTLTSNGTGVRELRVSYLSEVPIWKSTYRILITDPTGTAGAGAAGSGQQTATLQGWSVVDNTTGTDWDNVQLSLIAGSPQSFIQPISQPIYSRRPEIPIAQEAQLTPQTHESGDAEAAPPRVAGVAGMSGIGAGSGGGMGPGSGGAIGGPLASRRLEMRASSSNATVSSDTNSVVTAASPAPMIAYETSANSSITPATTTSAFDDYFEYKLTEPVTIRKNESALVPILQTRVGAERVTLWSPQQPEPLRALWITNTSSLTLDRGSFSIVENGNFGGEGLLDPVHPGERRLLSYAADQAVRVSTDSKNGTHRVDRLTVHKGVLTETTVDIAEVEYMVRNAAPERRTVIVEHPVRAGWTLDSDPKPTETTPTTYRFRVETAPGETVRLHVGEWHPAAQIFYLTNSTEEQMAGILRGADAGPATMAKLDPVFAAKRAVIDLDRQIAAKQGATNSIVEDQKRVRDNLGALKGSAEERSLARRYTEELNRQEDQIASLRKDLADLQTRRAAAVEELGRVIESVDLDEALR